VRLERSVIVGRVVRHPVVPALVPLVTTGDAAEGVARLLQELLLGSLRLLGLFGLDVLG
jgi:hypothetical protein